MAVSPFRCYSSTLPSSLRQLPFPPPLPLVASPVVARMTAVFSGLSFIHCMPQRRKTGLFQLLLWMEKETSFLEVPADVSSRLTRQTWSHAHPEDPCGSEWDEPNYLSQSEPPLKMRWKSFPPERGAQPRKELLSAPRSGCYFQEKMEKLRLGKHLPKWPYSYTTL